MRPSLSIAVAALFSGATVAQNISPREDVIAAEVPQEETGWEGDHLTGDWRGRRTTLVDRGIHFQAGYAAEVLGNVSGGMDRGAVVAGLLELGLELDFSRLGLWEGGSFRASSLYPHGASLSRKYSGDILTVSNIDGYDSFRLYELWFQQEFWDGAVSLRAGQLVADEEFAYTEAGGLFLNSAFGWPSFISGNVVNTGPAFFVAAPGVRLRIEPAERWFAQVGIYDGDSFDNADGDPRVNARGTRIHLSGEQGALGMAELGLRVGEAQRSPGEYKIGAWIHSGDFESNLHDTGGNPFPLTGEDPKSHRKNYGAYVTAEQRLWSEADGGGLTLFARGGISPRDRSFLELAVDGGLTYQGLLPGRDEDVLGVGAVHAKISEDLREAERLDRAINGAAYPMGYARHESVLEIFYLVQLKKWWSIQPDFQWVFNPGGGARASDAIVIGLRTSLVF